MNESRNTNSRMSEDRDLDRRCVRIVTGSRLHFGLLDTESPFGGVGLMIQEPAVEVMLFENESFRCCDPEKDRIEAIAARIAETNGEPRLPRCEVRIAKRPPSHCGLGSGTQLSLALAEAFAEFLEIPIAPEKIVIEIAGRGKRSAVGSHGYFQGGLIFEEAASASPLNSLHTRIEIPESWRVAILRPTHSSAAVCGKAEAEQFDRLPSVPSLRKAELRRIVTDSLLPAARERNFDEFADAVQRYNHASGELFAGVQGGPYNGAQVAEVVQWLVDHGARGVGQSSWGPGVFAWFESDDQWQAFRSRVPDGMTCVAATAVRNQGRDCSIV